MNYDRRFEYEARRFHPARYCQLCGGYQSIDEMVHRGDLHVCKYCWGDLNDGMSAEEIKAEYQGGDDDR